MSELPSRGHSALLSVAALAPYAVRYWPVLTRPRLDGKLGSIPFRCTNLGRGALAWCMRFA